MRELLVRLAMVVILATAMVDEETLTIGQVFMNDRLGRPGGLVRLTPGAVVRVRIEGSGSRPTAIVRRWPTDRRERSAMGA